MVAALSNLQRLENILSENAQQRELLAVISEKLGYLYTALRLFQSFAPSDRIMRLNSARVLSKQGKVDETLEILGEFDGTENMAEQKLIGFILYKIGQHEMAYEYLKKVLVDSNDFELYCAVGIIAVQARVNIVSNFYNNCFLSCLNRVKSSSNFINIIDDPH